MDTHKIDILLKVLSVKLSFYAYTHAHKPRKDSNIYILHLAIYMKFFIIHILYYFNPKVLKSIHNLINAEIYPELTSKDKTCKKINQAIPI